MYYLLLLYYLLVAATIITFFYVLVRLIIFTMGLGRNKSSWNLPIIWGLSLVKFPKIGVLMLVVLVFGFSIIQEVYFDNVRAKILNRLSKLARPYTVTIEGKIMPDPKVVVVALQQLTDISAHHSYPTHSFEVIIADKNGYITLVLARDSTQPSEYWVYSPKDDITLGLLNDQVTKGIAIGSIKTNILDSF